MNYFKKLKEFHKGIFKKTGDWRADTDQLFLNGNPTTELRCALIIEEMNELIHELRWGTEEKARKELCDLLYVVFGTAATYGWPVDEDFKLVHDNNMLKLTTGFIGPNGKLMKAKDHPKVELAKLNPKRPRTICGITQTLPKEDQKKIEARTAELQQELPLEYPVEDLPKGCTA